MTEQEWLAELDVVGVREIAERLEVEQQTVAQWRYRGTKGRAEAFPPARWSVSGLPAWSWWDDITPWAARTGRLARAFARIEAREANGAAAGEPPDAAPVSAPTPASGPSCDEDFGGEGAVPAEDRPSY